jgi:peptidoglycan/LPS O-acetylase OafA/YrhL
MMIAAVIDETTAFPESPRAPCLGAAILIAMPNSAMGSRYPYRPWWIEIFYSLYLWRWPVLAPDMAKAGMRRRNVAVRRITDASLLLVSLDRKPAGPGIRQKIASSTLRCLSSCRRSLCLRKRPTE